MFSKYYPRYADEGKVGNALDMYSKKKSVELDAELRMRIVKLIVTRLKDSRSFKLTEDDQKVVEEIRSKFGNMDFEKDFVTSIKKVNYCLERYKKGEIKYRKIEGGMERIFKETNKLVDGMEEYFDHKDWKFSLEKDDTKIYTRKLKGSSFLMVKGSTNFRSRWSYQKIVRYIYEFVINSCEPEDFIDYQKVDIDNAYSVDLHDYDENNCLTHLRYSSGSMIVYDREFVFTRKFHVDEKGKCAYVIGVSPEYYDEEVKGWLPQDKSGCVRGVCQHYSYQAKEMKDGSIRLSYAAHIDPCGWVPGFLFNLKVTNKGHGVTRYRQLINRLDKLEKEEEDEGEEDEGEEDEEDIEANLL